MRIILLVVSLLLSSIAPAAVGTKPWTLPIREIHDGDTIFSTAKLPPPLDEVEVRIKGIDTAEMPAKSYATTKKLGLAKCVQEAELALKARDAVIELAHGAKKMTLLRYEWDKYGGRFLADVSINGVDVAKFLIEKKLAIPYFGEEKTHDWCAPITP